MSSAGSYTVPDGPLCLSGPVARPEPGALPLRGDLAHIALAGTHLAAHYVVPHSATIGDDGAELFLAARADATVLQTLPAQTEVEILDAAGEWIWICLGPKGPAGYIKSDCLIG